MKRRIKVFEKKVASPKRGTKNATLSSYAQIAISRKACGVEGLGLGLRDKRRRQLGP